MVRCGEGDDIEDEHSRHQDRFALSEPVRHPDYTLTSQKIPEYDFALIKVDRPFELNINVDTMCMPTSHNDYDPNDCYATGFGKDRWGKLIKREQYKLYISSKINVFSNVVDTYQFIKCY